MLAASLPPGPVGGAEKQSLLLAEELARKGISVTFITPGKRPLAGSDIFRGIRVYRIRSVLSDLFDFLSGLKKKRKGSSEKIEYDDSREATDEITRPVGWPSVLYYNLFYWRSLIFLRRKRKSFDLIHAHTMEWSAIVAVRLGKRLKKPVLIKDSTMNGFASLLRYPNGRAIQQKIIKDARFVAMTRSIEENLIKSGVPREKIFRISNGIAITGTGPENKWTPGSSKVLFIGNLYQQPAKGVDLLLKAWSGVIADFPGAILQIIGDGVTPAYSAFSRRLGIQENVEFLGALSNLTPFFNEASLFVLPSRREGMSNALMEAMLFGLPCVATEISGSRDLIEHGVNGILVPPVDVEGLALGIKYILSHPAEASIMGHKARETIIQNYDIRLIAGKYITLYKDLIEERTLLKQI